MEKFETGKIVTLNSGSPWLTIGEVTEEKVRLHYYCEQDSMFAVIETTPAMRPMFRAVDDN